MYSFEQIADYYWYKYMTTADRVRMKYGDKYVWYKDLSEYGSPQSC